MKQTEDAESILIWYKERFQTVPYNIIIIVTIKEIGEYIFLSHSSYRR